MKWYKVLSQVFRYLPVLIMGQSLFFKFQSAPESVYIFTRVGMEPWGRYLTGTAELTSCLLLLSPRFSWLGAFIALDVMVGAIFSHLTLLGIEVQGDSGVLFAMACTVLACALLHLFQVRYKISFIGEFLQQSDDLAHSYGIKKTESLGQRLPILIIFSFSVLCVLGIAAQIFIIPTLADVEAEKRAYFLTIVSVFVTFGTAIYLVRVIERPLHQLILVCQEFSKGDHTVRSKLSASSELGLLSESINRMLSEIEKQEQELIDKSQSIQRLLRVVVHDVANPLSVVKLSSQLATQSKYQLDAQQTKYWSRVATASQQIDDIIRSTRDFEAMRSGIKKLNLQPLSLAKALEQIQQNFIERAEAKKISFLVRNESRLSDPTVLVEETLFLSSVVSNLVSNAIKFSSEGSTIDFVIQPFSEALLRLKVVDHGVGLPAATVALFNTGKNIQSKAGTKGEAGTGFGLDIARALMRSMGGELSLSSRAKDEAPDEHGTEVVLTIPLSANGQLSGNLGSN